MLIYYETVDIIKYLQVVVINKEALILGVTKLTVFKMLVLLLIML